jgi:hypothetical protein
MANVIQYATIFQNELDKAAVHDMLTGWMDANAGKVKYTGGKEVKIPQLSVDGLGDYDRGSAGGYAGGDIKFEYKTYEMTQDRGRKFSIDAMDVDESGFVLTAGNIMGEFQRTKVIPEIDAYRLSALATKAIGISGDTNAAYSYSVGSTTILEKIKNGIKVVRENGYNGQLVIHASYDTVNALELAMSNKIASVTFAQGGINTQVPAIDNCPIIPTPSNRLYSSITLYDGVTEGQKAGGYIKGVSGIDANFIIVPRDIPIAITKQDVMRIFDPMTNQQANAWSLDYRRYHDIWVLENKIKGIYASFKDSKPGV